MGVEENSLKVTILRLFLLQAQCRLNSDHYPDRITNALLFSGLVFQSLVLAEEPHYDVRILLSWSLTSLAKAVDSFGPSSQNVLISIYPSSNSYILSSRP